MITKETSREIKMLVYICTLMVVYIHVWHYPPWLEGNPDQEYKILDIFEMLLSEGVCRIAVPMFFLLSGFFLFMKVDFREQWYKKAMKRRLFTLVTPYLAWNVLNLFLFFVWEHFIDDSLIARQSVAEMSLTEILQSVFLSNFCGQLWYIKRLICFVALTPFLVYFYRKIPIITVLVFGLLWLFKIHYWADIHYAGGLFFFSLGAVIAINNYNIEDLAIKNYILPSFFCLLLTRALVSTFYQVPLTVLGNITIILGIIIMWSKRRLLHTVLKKHYCLTCYSFFIYAFHEAFLSMLFKVSIRLLGESEPMRIFLLLVLPLATATTGICIASVLKKNCSPIYLILTGGR